MPSDAHLIEQILAGQSDHFAVLVSRYERLAVATAIRRVGDSHLADDVAQEAFLAAFQKLSSLRDRSNFGGWLLGIVRHHSLRVVAKDKRVESHADPTLMMEPHHDFDSRADETGALLELVERLPEHERVIVGLRYFDGHSVQEIADFTARPIGTVTKQLSRAHRRLRVWMTPEVQTK
ncbi:MAG: sigma-70 family RNA polymerase sigma factor [Planctomycetota bacterium]